MKHKNPGDLVFAVCFLIASLLFFSFFIFMILPSFDTVTFKETGSTGIGIPFLNLWESSTRLIEKPAWVLLLWPILFFTGGLAYLSKYLGKKRFVEFFAGIIFAGIGGGFFFIFKPPLPYNLIALFFLLVGYALMRKSIDPFIKKTFEEKKKKD